MYVYFLKLSNNDIYVGSTNDLRRRVASHNDGQVVSTRDHRGSPLTPSRHPSGDAVPRTRHTNRDNRGSPSRPG
ncbi:MAG: GIY-YIG nuclease family protein [Bradyrhizobium sp.]